MAQDSGSPAVAAPGKLLRVFGMAFAIAMVIGATIGSGILATPGTVAALLPSVVWIMALWLFGGINSLFGAAAYAELGAMMPCAGGPYVFTRRALGNFAGFFTGYLDLLQNCATEAAIALLIGEYSGRLVPALQGHAQVVAICVFLLLAGLNWIQVRLGGWVQQLTSLAKVLGLLALVVAAFVLPHTAPTAATPAPMPQGLALLAACALAMQSVIFTYNGFHFPVYFGEELKDPGREIPRSLFQGLYVIIAVYLLMNAAFLWVIPLSALANDPFAGGTVARILFGDRGDVVITLIVVISMLGTLNSGILGIPRIAYQMGRDGLLPRQATRVNAGGTPDIALLGTVIVTLAFFFSGTFNAALAISTVLTVAMYVMAFVSVFVLRKREPRTPRPYRAWGHPWTTGAGLLIGIAFLVGVGVVDPFNSAIGIGLVIVSYPVYRIVAGYRADAAQDGGK